MNPLDFMGARPLKPFDRILNEEAAYHLRESCEIADVTVLGWPVVVNPQMDHGLGILVPHYHLACCSGRNELHVAPTTFTTMAVPRIWWSMEILVMKGVAGGM